MKKQEDRRMRDGLPGDAQTPQLPPELQLEAEEAEAFAAAAERLGKIARLAARNALAEAK